LTKRGNIIKVNKLTGMEGTCTACVCQTKKFGRKTSGEEQDHFGGLNLGNKVMTKWFLRETGERV
jgi:hypothetical protein